MKDLFLDSNWFQFKTLQYFYLEFFNKLNYIYNNQQYLIIGNCQIDYIIKYFINFYLQILKNKEE